MNKLNKKHSLSKNTVEAYAFGCSCNCVCYCIKIWKLDLYANGFADPSSQIAFTPKVR